MFSSVSEMKSTLKSLKKDAQSSYSSTSDVKKVVEEITTLRQYNSEVIESQYLAMSVLIYIFWLIRAEYRLLMDPEGRFIYSVETKNLIHEMQQNLSAGTVFSPTQHFLLSNTNACVAEQVSNLLRGKVCCCFIAANYPNTTLCSCKTSELTSSRRKKEYPNLRSCQMRTNRMLLWRLLVSPRPVFVTSF